MQTPLLNETELELNDLNNNFTMWIAVSSATGKHIKYRTTQELAIFANLDAFYKYKNSSKIMEISTPYEVTFVEAVKIAQQEAEGKYKILY